MPFDLEAFRYFINNPSAWEHGFDQKISDQMESAVKEIDSLRGRVLMGWRPDQGGMTTMNPAPDASPPHGPTGRYGIFEVKR